jgi:hypothetical protein
MADSGYLGQVRARKAWKAGNPGWLFFALLCTLFLVWGPLRATERLTANPAELTFDCLVNDIIVLGLELTAPPGSTLAMEFEGVSADRKLKLVAPGRWRILIAPETFHTGQVDGVLRIEQVGGAGYLTVPIRGFVRARLECNPPFWNLGMLSLSAGKSGRQIRQTLTLRVLSGDPVSLTGIDAEGLNGIRAHIVAPDAMSDSWHVELVCDVEALIAGRNAGEIFRGALLLRTTLPHEPAIAVPILGVIVP